MKAKDKVYYYEIKIDFHKYKLEQKCEEYTVLGVNDLNLVINDREFTAIKRKKRYRGDKETLFNETVVYDSKFGMYWDEIVAYLYTSTTSKKIAYRRLKKALEKFIYDKHGRYCNAIAFLDKIEI